ncbi:(ABC) transporter, partial [Perkinsus olseni]
MALCCKRRRTASAPGRPTTISFFKLFSLASRTDWILLAVGVFAASINGAAFPAFSLFIGDFMDEVGTSFATGDVTGILSNVRTVSLRLVVVAAVAFCSAFAWDAIFTYCSTTITTRIRIGYFRAVLNQDVSWFDQETPAALPSRMNEDIFKVQEAIGYRVGLTVANFFQFAFGYGVGLYRGWQLALVMMSTMPLLTASIAVLSRRIAKKTARAQDFYAEAGAVAEEVLSAMKTVVAFGAEKRETERYGAKLVAARDGEIRAGFHSGVMTGIVFLSIFFTYALVFWYGGKLIYDGTNNPSTGEPYNG